MASLPLPSSSGEKLDLAQAGWAAVRWREECVKPRGMRQNESKRGEKTEAGRFWGPGAQAGAVLAGNLAVGE